MCIVFGLLALFALPSPEATVDREYAQAVSTIVRADDLGIKTGDAKPLRLIRPLAVAVDSSARLFVADPGHQSVIVYDRQRQTATRWTGNTQVPLLGPAALTFDSAGRLFVADVYKSQVVVFDRDGKAVSAFGKGHLRRPAAIAVDNARGRLYVGDIGLRHVVSFDLQTLSPGKTFPISGSDPANSASPGAIAVNSAGQIYVTDLRSCVVRVFDAEGALQRDFKTGCSRPDESSRPMAIGRDDVVYVADPSRNTVEGFDASGAALFTSDMAKRATAASSRTGIAVDDEGRVYITEHGPDEGRLQVLQISRTRRKK